MKAIYKRELAGYFKSMIGYFFMFFLFVVTGIYFAAYNLSFRYPSMDATMNSVTFVFLIAVPILTMRVLAEERRQKTDQLLLTAPVSVIKIVCGKYFALVTAFLIPMLIISLYPLILRQFGKISFVQNYTAILGFFLLGAANIAIGMFMSSLTENQIVAAVLTFVVMFVCYMMGAIESLLSGAGKGVKAVLDVFDVDSRFQTFISGTFDLTAVFYFVSVIFIFVFLTTQSIKKRRWS